MGLTAIEIVMEVEETFDITIYDEEAERIVTVGDLHEAVWRKVAHRQGDACVSSHHKHEIVGDVVRALASRRRHGTKRRYPRTRSEHPWTRQECWESICRILVKILDVQPEDVVKDAKIVGDLGAD